MWDIRHKRNIILQNTNKWSTISVFQFFQLIQLTKNMSLNNQIKFGSFLSGTKHGTDFFIVVILDLILVLLDRLGFD